MTTGAGATVLCNVKSRKIQVICSLLMGALLSSCALDVTFRSAPGNEFTIAEPLGNYQLAEWLGGAGKIPCMTLFLTLLYGWAVLIEPSRKARLGVAGVWVGGCIATLIALRWFTACEIIVKPGANQITCVTKYGIGYNRTDSIDLQEVTYINIIRKDPTKESNSTVVRYGVSVYIAQGEWCSTDATAISAASIVPIREALIAEFGAKVKGAL